MPWSAPLNYPLDFFLPMGNIRTASCPSQPRQVNRAGINSEMDGSASSPTGQSPWMPFESRRRARDEKREAVLRTAVALFLEQGYHGTTLNHVAERLNITKPALYNYFRGKDEILYECWAIGAEQVDECIDKIAATGGTGLEKLRELIVSYAETMTTDYGKS